MFKTIMAVSALALLGSAAQAADLSYADGSNAIDWSGAYAGVTAGYGSSDFEPRVGANFLEQGLNEDLNHKADGWSGGLMAGYNQQSGDWVYGVELNASLADISGSAENDVLFSVPGFNNGEPFLLDQTQTSRINSLYSARIRLGRAMGPVLLFATAGVAGAEAKTDFEVRSVFGNVTSNDEAFHTGYTVGAGVDYKLTSDISTRVEYAYFEFGTEAHQGIAFELNQQVVRGGVAYHFGL